MALGPKRWLMSQIALPLTVDPISLEVFRNLFASVAEEMGVTLQRAAFSPNIRERLDFSCAVFDSKARMIAQAAHIPVHLGSMPASVEAAIAAFTTFVPGDVILLNDPYRGGTHLPDITMVSPVFSSTGLIGFVASRAHHADVGGMSPGSLPLSTELYQEGIIIPPVKLMTAGTMNEAVLALITANSRAPEERIGDLQAQLAAQRIGERRLLALAESQGESALLEHAAALLDYSRRMTEAVIATIPQGVYTFEDALEGDGQTEFRIPIRCTITVAREVTAERQRSRVTEGVESPSPDSAAQASLSPIDSAAPSPERGLGGEVLGAEFLTVDFTGTAPQVLGNVNAVEAIVRSATWYCIRLLATEDVPVNHGCFEPVRVIIPPGSLLNPAFPAAVAVGNTETGQRVVDVVLGALSLALPERIPAASQGTMNNVTIGGTHNGRAFVYYETIGGGHGAGPQGDGLSARHSHMTNTRNTPVEALEPVLPLRVLEYGLRDSPLSRTPSTAGRGVGGEGGSGIRRVYEFLTAATVTVNSERRTAQPYGLNGGAAGQPGRNTLVMAGTAQPMPGKFTAQVQPGDRLVIETPGGGDWGSVHS